MDLLLGDAQDTKELLGCVGYCRMFVLDSDGLQRKTKGSRLEAPVHVQHDKNTGTRTISAYFPVKDPVSMLKVQCDQQEFIYAKIWAGAICRPDENPNGNRLFCVLEGQNCKKLVDEAQDSPDHTFKCPAFMPFIPNCYASPIQATITIAEEKFIIRVVKIEVEVPKDAFEKWLHYYRTLRKIEKEEAADKNDKK